MVIFLCICSRYDRYSILIYECNLIFFPIRPGLNLFVDIDYRADGYSLKLFATSHQMKVLEINNSVTSIPCLSEINNNYCETMDAHESL